MILEEKTENSDNRKQAESEQEADLEKLTNTEVNTLQENVANGALSEESNSQGNETELDENKKKL